MNGESVLYLYSITEDIKFDVGEDIETYVWMNNGKAQSWAPNPHFRAIQEGGGSIHGLGGKNYPTS